MYYNVVSTLYSAHVYICVCVQVLNDRLQYFRKMEDCKSAKEPVAFIRMSQVREKERVHCAHQCMDM